MARAADKVTKLPDTAVTVIPPRELTVLLLLVTSTTMSPTCTPNPEVKLMDVLADAALPVVVVVVVWVKIKLSEATVVTAAGLDKVTDPDGSYRNTVSLTKRLGLVTSMTISPACTSPTEPVAVVTMEITAGTTPAVNTEVAVEEAKVEWTKV